MIRPQARKKLTEDDFNFVVTALCRKGEKESTLRMLLTDAEMRDSMLDHPRLLEFLLQYRQTSFISPLLYFYILLRHVLIKNNLDDRSVADYLASLLAEFGKQGRAHQVNAHATKEYYYLVDLMNDLVESSSEETFYLRSHLGNYALFLTGLFPDYVYHRAKYHPPSPDFSYYEQVGSNNYQLASKHAVAERFDLGDVLYVLARHFKTIRHSLNELADNYLYLDHKQNSTDRVMRRVDQFIER